MVSPVSTLAAVAVLLSAAAALAAPAQAEESAQDTISKLQQQGYVVTLDKIGTGPLSKCQVLSVRNPQTITQWVPFVGPGLGSADGNFLVPAVTSRTISVSLDCSAR